MCGFIGRISVSGAPADDLRRGLPWIARRGPDSQRLWSTPDGRVSILFCRLAIVDRDPRAHQPLSKAGSGVTVGMVGEIYNYCELRETFRDYPFETDSDTEIILAAYAAHGPEGLALLKGMYAFVLVDERAKKIFLIRDSIGKKPLFIARWGEDVFFGSSLLPLVAANKGKVDLDPSQAPYYWKHTFIHPGSSALAGAAPVLPGQMLELDWSGRPISQGRCEPKAARLYDGEPLDRVIENVGLLVSGAVNRRLANNPAPTVLLSGGVDSTLVTAAMRDACSGSSLPPLKSLTLGSLVPFTYDERYARYAARTLGIPLQTLTPRFGSLGESILQALDLQDEPLGMPSYFLLERLTNAAAKHGRVLLSGEGGDEIFLGYGKPPDWMGNGGPRVEAGSFVPCGPKLPAWMSEWAKETVTNTLVGHMFAKADRATAEQGVELRCPLLDWDVAAYARTIPFAMLTHDGISKAVLKDQLRGWPEWFLERPKAGFTYNLRWLWGMSLYSGFRESIDERAVELFGPLVPAALRKPRERWRSTDIFSHFNEAWRLLAWSCFCRRFDRASSAS
jgi:asparagine synthase (glutamine-hydrolysing)